MEIQINISVGELIDKITILQIKKEKITNLEKVKKASYELELLEKSLNSFKTSKTEELKDLINELKIINQKLWVIEDDIRLLEKNKKFESEFIELARSVYMTNDKRFEVKNKINKLFSSDIQEVKSYEEY
jgi:DNA mismatch repair ATPase MutS|tara:strand:+ start:34 stop:423 length:390 start_codon:yes stop_codon:yes gene_type:complete